MVVVSCAIRRLDASPEFTYFIACENLGITMGKYTEDEEQNVLGRLHVDNLSRAMRKVVTANMN